MKRVILPLMLVFFVSLMAVESAPSDVVGFVKFDGVAGFNMVSTAMDAGYTMASELGNTITGCTSVTKWDAATQSWSQASNLGFMWLPDFALDPNQAYLVNIPGATSIYVAGGMNPDPSYGLVAGFNTVMVPLDNASTMASGIGNSITGCTSVTRWVASSQSWEQASNLGFMWLPDFGIGIADPLLVNVSSASTWPTTRAQAREDLNNTARQ